MGWIYRADVELGKCNGTRPFFCTAHSTPPGLLQCGNRDRCTYLHGDNKRSMCECNSIRWIIHAIIHCTFVCCSSLLYHYISSARNMSSAVTDLGHIKDEEQDMASLRRVDNSVG